MFLLGLDQPIPIGSIYGVCVFAYIYHKKQSNLGKYTIHGSHAICYQVWHPGRWPGLCLRKTLPFLNPLLGMS